MRPRFNAATMLALGLIIANGFTSKQFHRIGALVMSGTQPLQNSGTSLVDAATAIRSDIFTIGGELVFLLILSTVAESGGEAPVMALVIALWLIWIINNGPQVKSAVDKFASGATPPKGTTGNPPGFAGGQP